MNALKNAWQNYLTGGGASLQGSLLFRLKFVNAFSVVGVTSLLIFGAVNLSDGAFDAGIMELILGAIAIINVFYLRYSGNLTFSTNVILGLMFVILGFLTWQGGIAGTGLFWFFTFPPLAFFLKGKRNGWHWIGALYALLFCLFIVQFWVAAPISRSFVEIRQLFASLLAVSFLVYFYETVNDERKQSLGQQTARTDEANQALRVEIDKRRETENALQKQNRSLEELKIAMLNVLEDLKEERDRTMVERARDEALLANIGEGMVAVDTDDHIININPAGAKILGTSVRAAINKKYYAVWDVIDETGKTIERKHRPIEQALRGEKISTTALYYQGDGRAPVPVSITATPVKLGKKLIGVITVFRDISKEREIDRAKTEFVSMASHQLRTPLTAIRWSAELLGSAKTGTLNASQKKFLKNIYTSNERMIELVNALLNVSRIDMGAVAIEPQPTDVAKVAENLLTELAGAMQKKKITLKKSYDKKLPTLNADPQLLRIALQNLLTNAIKYTPEQGRIAFSMKRAEKNLLITVADTGYGIPKDQQSKIFTKLFRADNIRKMDTDGTGLGLYITRSVIAAAGGTIWFESEENKGSTFYVSLPLSGMKKKEGAKGLVPG